MQDQRAGPAVWTVDKLQEAIEAAARALLQPPPHCAIELNRVEGVLARAPDKVWASGHKGLKQAFWLIRAAIQEIIVPDQFAQAKLLRDNFREEVADEQAKHAAEKRAGWSRWSRASMDGGAAVGHSFVKSGEAVLGDAAATVE